MMKVTAENIKEMLDQLPVKRLRVESVIEELLSANICRQEDIVISPERSSGYNFERDVTEVEEVYNPLNGGPWFKIKTPRDGFYDSLPERLFHKPVGRIKHSEEWDEIRIEEIKQEIDARLFFSPFDNAINHHKVRIERFEKLALAGQETSFLKEFLTIFWPQSHELGLSEEQQFNLFHLTIIAHKVAGNIAWMEECFARLLGDPVELYYENVAFEVPITNEFPLLGQAFLGADYILAPKVLEKWRRLKIQVGPLNYEQMYHYFGMRKGEKLLQFLCHLLVPVEIDWTIKLIPKVCNEDKKEDPDTLIHFSINDQEKHAFLGYTTVL